VAGATHPPAEGDVAPTFLGRGLDHKVVSLDTYRGKVVVLSFWATWCPPCRQELPILANIQRAGKGWIQVIAVNTETRAVFEKAAKILVDYDLLLANDVDGRSFKAFGAQGLPHLVVVGKDGRIVSVHEGYGSGEIPDLADEISGALKAGTEGAADAPGQPTG
jgi:thiol-disulfide isomerase/thioredoxin